MTSKAGKKIMASNKKTTPDEKKTITLNKSLIKNIIMLIVMNKKISEKNNSNI